MAFENLDPQDKAILDAIVAGKTDDEVTAEFSVDAEKIAQLKGHLANDAEEVEVSEEEILTGEASGTDESEGGGGEDAI